MDIKSLYIFCVLFYLSPGEHCSQTVYSKIGENIYLHVPPRESQGRSFPAIDWRHQKKLIAKTTRFNGTSAEVFSNGTLKLNNVGRNCRGIYTANTYDDQGKVQLIECFHLFVIDPPVVELVACTLGVSVLHCVGEHAPDAGYEWIVSVQNQGVQNISKHAGKYVSLNYSTGNISCSLKIGNYSSQSEAYSLSCAGPGLPVPETKWCVSLEVAVMLGFVCFMMCGISVGVQIYCKQRNLSVQSERSGPSLETQDDGIVYSEVRGT